MPYFEIIIRKIKIWIEFFQACPNTPLKPLWMVIFVNIVPNIYLIKQFCLSFLDLYYGIYL